MIGNIRDCTSDETLTVYTNGNFQVLPMVSHFNSGSMANILAIKDVASIPGVHINMDSRKERAIIVEYNNHIIKFQECCYGLYYYDTVNKFISHINSYSFLSTAKDNKEYFSTL